MLAQKLEIKANFSQKKFLWGVFGLFDQIITFLANIALHFLFNLLQPSYWFVIVL